ncbi:hypothetical protein AWENTII_006257 [Aspergillus wentii]
MSAQHPQPMEQGLVMNVGHKTQIQIKCFAIRLVPTLRLTPTTVDHVAMFVHLETVKTENVLALARHVEPFNNVILGVVCASAQLKALGHVVRVFLVVLLRLASPPRNVRPGKSVLFSLAVEETYAILFNPTVKLQQESAGAARSMLSVVTRASALENVVTWRIPALVSLSSEGTKKCGEEEIGIMEI